MKLESLSYDSEEDKVKNLKINFSVYNFDFDFSPNILTYIFLRFGPSSVHVVLRIWATGISGRRLFGQNIFWTDLDMSILVQIDLGMSYPWTFRPFDIPTGQAS